LRQEAARRPPRDDPPLRPGPRSHRHADRPAAPDRLRTPGAARHLPSAGDGRAHCRRRARAVRPDRRARRARVTLVVALGGNALGRGTAAEQLAVLREACAAIAPLVREGEVVITHGNGPQVGNELLRQERAADEVPPLPLYLAVAQTQAEIGALIETELAAATGRRVACLVTHVHVDPDDPAFERLVILTEVPAVYRLFRESDQEEIRELSIAGAQELLAELAEGSMRPKVEAALDFARTGGETLITSFDALADALEGRAGTRITS